MTPNTDDVAGLVAELRDRDGIVMGGLFTAIPLLRRAAIALEAQAKALRDAEAGVEAWMQQHSISETNFQKAIYRALAVEARLKEAEKVIESMVAVVGNMRVPQNTAEAAVQAFITVGPALRVARAFLNAGEK